MSGLSLSQSFKRTTLLAAATLLPAGCKKSEASTQKPPQPHLEQQTSEESIVGRWIVPPDILDKDYEDYTEQEHEKFTRQFTYAETLSFFDDGDFSFKTKDMQINPQEPPEASGRWSVVFGEEIKIVIDSGELVIDDIIRSGKPPSIVIFKKVDSSNFEVIEAAMGTGERFQAYKESDE